MGILAVILGEAAKLVAHHQQCFVVQPQLAELALLDQLCQTLAEERQVALLEDRSVARERLEIAGLQAEVGGPHHLALAHRNAAQDLRQIFGEAQLQDQPLALAEGAGALQAARPVERRAQRRHIGRKPRKAVRRVLIAIERRRIDLSSRRQLRSERGPRPRQHAFSRLQRLIAGAVRTNRHEIDP